MGSRGRLREFGTRRRAARAEGTTTDVQRRLGGATERRRSRPIPPRHGTGAAAPIPSSASAQEETPDPGPGGLAPAGFSGFAIGGRATSIARGAGSRSSTTSATVRTRSCTCRSPRRRRRSGTNPARCASWDSRSGPGGRTRSASSPGRADPPSGSGAAVQPLPLRGVHPETDRVPALARDRGLRLRLRGGDPLRRGEGEPGGAAHGGGGRIPSALWEDVDSGLEASLFLHDLRLHRNDPFARIEHRIPRGLNLDLEGSVARVKDRSTRAARTSPTRGFRRNAASWGPSGAFAHACPYRRTGLPARAPST